MLCMIFFMSRTLDGSSCEVDACGRDFFPKNSILLMMEARLYGNDESAYRISDLQYERAV